MNYFIPPDLDEFKLAIIRNKLSTLKTDEDIVTYMKSLPTMYKASVVRKHFDTLKQHHKARRLHNLVLGWEIDE